ncbi:MAG: hypothetical protein HOP11_05595, partial [Saprospiraceae bacterium]|nr:hypothetical protein [Saprospiraceae bacterium]
LYTSILSILFLTCCDKNSGGMDPCDNCHTNIFKCKINGVDWKSDCIPDPLFGCNSISLTFDNNSNDLEIIGSNDKLKNVIKLSSRSIIMNSKSFLKDNSGYSDRNFTGGCNYFEFIKDTSYTYIKVNDLDRSKRILTCVFEMHCLGRCGDLIKVTNGRFSVKY